MAMKGYRSKSYADGRMQVVPYGLRSYSSSSSSSSSRSSRGYFSSYEYQYEYNPDASKGMEVYRGKQPAPSNKPSLSSSSSNRGEKSGGSGGGWVFTDPDFQRKKRVASYRAYSAEGKLKRSFGRSFRWLKDRYNDVVYGWW